MILGDNQPYTGVLIAPDFEELEQWAAANGIAEAPPEQLIETKEVEKLFDAEVKRIMTDAHARARTILTGKRDMLEKVTRQLLEVEVMEGDTLRAILGVPPGAIRESAEGTPLPPELR